MEGSLVAYKVFTNGSTLQASELNENLMQQATAVFSNAAARTAAITSPVEGQLTYLEDTNRYSMWNGSAWVSPFGSTLVASSTFTAQTSVAFDGAFSSEFTFYDIYITVISSVTASFSARLRSGATDLSSSTYTTNLLTVSNTSVTGARTTATEFTFPNLRATAKNPVFFSLFNPFLANNTSMIFSGAQYSASDPLAISYSAGNSNNTVESSYDGIRFFSSTGTMSGEISIYGRKR
jgi:hypothetical protein